MGCTGLPGEGLHRTVLLSGAAPVLLQTRASDIIASDEVDELSESCNAEGSQGSVISSTISCPSCAYGLVHMQCGTSGASPVVDDWT